MARMPLVPGLHCQTGSASHGWPGLPLAVPSQVQVARGLQLEVVTSASGLNLTLPVGPLRMPLRLPGTGASTRATGRSSSSRGPPARRGMGLSGCRRGARRARPGRGPPSGRRSWQPERRARVRSACGALQLKFGTVAGVPVRSVRPYMCRGSASPGRPWHLRTLRLRVRVSYSHGSTLALKSRVPTGARRQTQLVRSR